MSTRTLASLLVLAAVAGCVGVSRSMNDPGIPSDATDVAIRRDPAAGEFATNSGIPDSTRLAIRNESAWHESWAAIVDGRSPAPAAPAVNFETEMVLLAAMGTRPNGGYVIRIDRVARRGNDLWAEVRSSEFGRGCMNTMALTAPTDVAIVPKVSGRVSFVEVKDTVNC